MREDGSIDIVPVQVFKTDRGTELRIGRTLLMFDEHGRYSGIEHDVRDLGLKANDPEWNEIKEAIATTVGNLGKAPEQAYYEPDTDGHRHETRGWPKQPVAPSEQSRKQQAYSVRQLVIEPPPKGGPKN